MANLQFIEIYMQFRDPLQSCQALRVGYWTGNRCIDRTVEAPKKPSGRLIKCHLLFINTTLVYKVAIICTYHPKISPSAFLQLAAATG